MTDEAADLAPGEYHPAASLALAWLRGQGYALFDWQETFASCALAGNRTAVLCGETLRRVLAGEPVSDRYLLALCWTMRNAEDEGPPLPDSPSETEPTDD